MIPPEVKSLRGLQLAKGFALDIPAWSELIILASLVPMKMDSDQIGQKVYLSAQGRAPVRG
jgi:hypothetical protein